MKTAIAAAPMDDYQAEGDFHTLTRAEEIKADAKRHEKAMSHGKQKVAAMQAVVEPGEGTPAEERKDKAQGEVDAKLPKRGARTTTHVKVKAMSPTKRVAKVNRSAVI